MLDNLSDALVEPLIGQVKTYLKADLDLFFHVGPWRGTDNLPAYLTAAYALYRVQLLNHSFTGLVDKTRGRWTAATVAKQAKQVDAIRNLPGVVSIFIAEACSYHQRRQLIEQKVNFIIPGNQIYLPAIGMVLQERLKRLPEPVTELSPAAAILVLKALTGQERTFTPSTIAPAIGYTAMTLTRAFNELESAQLAQCREVGRQRVLDFVVQGRELWEKAKAVLGTPVKSRHWVTGGTMPKGPLAGLHALAVMTHLAGPAGTTIAIDRKEGRNWIVNHPKVTAPREISGATEMQVWRYSPELFAKDGLVDPFSLYLSLRQEQDERVEMAVEQLEKALW